MDAEKIIATHPLSCTCDVCMAFVNANCGMSGLKAAQAILDARNAAIELWPFTSLTKAIQ